MSGKICNYNKNQYTDTRTDFWLIRNGARENASFQNCAAKQEKRCRPILFFFFTWCIMICIYLENTCKSICQLTNQCLFKISIIIGINIRELKPLKIPLSKHASSFASIL